MKNTETIVAIATPAGRGGVGIVRVSGPNALLCAKRVTGKTALQARKAVYADFFDEKSRVIDQGLVIYFQAPQSFTGEEVIEFQGHGGPVILDQLLKTCLTIPSVRLARPGEFSERAFLNDKIDLVQAEAIADLIEATTAVAARSAMRSLQGEFSKHIQGLLNTLIQLRMYVEAAIDFPEEEIDFLNDGHIAVALQQLMESLATIQATAKQGALLQEGLHVVIAGKPNAGKSSLLNALSGKESAIVTDIAGTTRDVLREQIHLQGMPLHIFDTAGLHETDNVVEKIGIHRALAAIEAADIILLVIDVSTDKPGDILAEWPALLAKTDEKKVCVVANKIDLTNAQARIEKNPTYDTIYLSAKSQAGMVSLQQYLMEKAGFDQALEGVFMARRRHVAALDQTKEHLCRGQQQLQESQAGELLAEELRLAQQALGKITGEFSADDLLGEIFSSFCIGK